MEKNPNGRPRTNDKPATYRRSRVVNFVAHMHRRAAILGASANMDMQKHEEVQAVKKLVTDMMAEFNIDWEELS
jgi:hypothetical protein